MCWVTHVILFFFFNSHCSAYNGKNMRSRKKNRIEIHFVSLGRNGKMDDRVLKWLSLLSKEQSTMKDPKSGVRGHFSARLLS